MKFETLHDDRIKKKIIIGIAILIFILIAIIVSTSLSKYQVTQSINIASGTINYSPYDFMIDGIFIGDSTDYTETDTAPTSGYVFNSTKSYCTKSGEVLEDVILGYDMSTQTFTLTNYNQKGIKCYLYFDEQTGIEILATIDGLSSGTFPTKASDYTPNSVTCTNDATATFDYVDWAVEVDSVEETTCTVNFEENKNTSFATYLKNKACSSTPTTDDEAQDCLVNENGYRYEGSNPNNYVLFNDELWRVIGVFDVTNSETKSIESLVKIIRNDMLDTLSWDASSEYGSNDWSSATLQSLLNGAYLNATDATCNVFMLTNSKTCYFSKKGLNEVARNMIQSVTWNLGGLSVSSSDENYYRTTTDNFYKYERQEIVYGDNSISWSGKIGLMYPSDYGYGVLATNCARTTLLSSYNTISCAGSNWLYKHGDTWFLTPSSSSENGVYDIYDDNRGLVSTDFSSYGHAVFPALYLKSNVLILGGNGSFNMPYIVE